MEKTPNTQEIIQIMKDACKALEAFNKKHRKINLSEQTERELEAWSNNLRCQTSTLNARIINK